MTCISFDQFLQSQLAVFCILEHQRYTNVPRTLSTEFYLFDVVLDYNGYNVCSILISNESLNNSRYLIEMLNAVV